VPEADRLTAAFLAEIAPTSRHRIEPDLADVVAAACARGRAAFQELALADETFARHLGRSLARNIDSTPISALAIEDLYLACACFSGVPGAADALTGRHLTTIRRSIRRVVRGPDASEIEQELLTQLLVGSGAIPPSIGAYAGRAPLARWLGVVAHRAALRWGRDDRAETEAMARVAREPPLARETSVETTLLGERYRGDFEQSLREALGRVPERSRALLRLHLVSNVSVDKIGKMMGVSQPTASRHLAKAREALLVDLKSILRDRLAISSGEIESLADLLGSRLDLSISQMLRTG
jgi:RNA polymerase sigma-70 factor (ECF subfamily)